MKFIFIVLAVVVGLAVYNIAVEAYAFYMHEEKVKQCIAEIQVPSWAEGLRNYGCEEFVD